MRAPTAKATAPPPAAAAALLPALLLALLLLAAAHAAAADTCVTVFKQNIDNGCTTSPTLRSYSCVIETEQIEDFEYNTITVDVYYITNGGSYKEPLVGGDTCSESAKYSGSNTTSCRSVCAVNQLEPYRFTRDAVRWCPVFEQSSSINGGVCGE
ncbi:MAG: hypothetical protein J3K34DRAFT_397540 [Monoraphidium minutum]|nr:MAG: hypothetical protein J3K34DRAFT_397540 [Monoraphidium minutum]